jgi:septal ring-binding cell division protein DamX
MYGTYTNNKTAQFAYKQLPETLKQYQPYVQKIVNKSFSPNVH